jgi:U3 small nucleolar RNA-associated protein 14
MISFFKFISHASFDFISKSENAVAKQPKKRGVHFAEVDLNEEADSLSESSERSDDEDAEMGAGDSDEFIDVLAVFDGKGEADNGSDSGGAAKQDVKGRRTPQVDDEDTSENEENYLDKDDEGQVSDSDEPEDDAIIISASDDDEDPSPEALTSLETFISTLDPSKKRKAPADEEGIPFDADAPPRTQKRRIIKERTEAGLENEFGAQASGKRFVYALFLYPC